MGHKETDNEELLDLWENSTESQRWVIFILCWLEMQKKTKLFWLFISTAVASLIVFAIFRDPVATGLSLVAGLAIGWLIFWR